MEAKSEKSASLWEKCEVLINTANHCLIAITTFYLMWYCLNFYNLTGTLNQHAWITAVGYQVLMAEGIMAIYKANSLTSLSSKREKNHIHWILQVIGGTMALYGIIIEIVNKERAGRSHFKSLHAKYGECHKEISIVKPHLCIWITLTSFLVHFIFGYIFMEGCNLM